MLKPQTLHESPVSRVLGLVLIEESGSWVQMKQAMAVD